jgi:hypothetical protein
LHLQAPLSTSPTPGAKHFSQTATESSLTKTGSMQIAPHSHAAARDVAQYEKSQQKFNFVSTSLQAD